MLLLLSKIGQRNLNWEWAILVAITPAFLAPGWWSWLGLSLIIMSGLLRKTIKGSYLPRTALNWSLVLLVIGAVIGLYASFDLNISLNRFWSLLAGINLFFAFAGIQKRETLANRAGYGLAGLGMLAGLISLVGTDWGRGELIKLPVLYDRFPHLISNFFRSGASSEKEINIRVVGGTMAMLVILIWQLGLAARSISGRVFIFLLAIFLSFLLLLTQAPTAIGGVLLAAVLFWGTRILWSGLPRRVFFVVIGALAFAIIVITPLAISWLARQLPPSNAEPTLRIILRQEMWLRSLVMLADKPFTGIGLNNFRQSMYKFYPTYSLGPEAHAHNVLLQTTLDGGIPGLAGFLGVLGGVFVTFRRAWLNNSENKQIKLLISGIAIGTLAWLFFGVAESITLGHKPALILWVMWGIVAALAQPDNYSKCEKSAQFRIGLKAAVILGITIVVLTVLTIGQDKLRLNLAIISGQRAILSGNSTQLTAAYLQFKEVLVHNQAISSATLDLEARLYESQGAYAEALEFLYKEAQQDQEQTVFKYIPGEWELWKTRAEGYAPFPLQRLYSQWKDRYAADPLAYARLGIVYDASCELDLAHKIVTEGLSHTAAPLLAYLETKIPYFCKKLA